MHTRQGRSRGGGEKEGKDLKQAELSVEPALGVHLMTLTLCPETKPKVRGLTNGITQAPLCLLLSFFPPRDYILHLSRHLICTAYSGPEMAILI